MGWVKAHFLKQTAVESPQDEAKGSGQLLRIPKAQGSQFTWESFLRKCASPDTPHYGHAFLPCFLESHL